VKHQDGVRRIFAPWGDFSSDVLLLYAEISQEGFLHRRERAKSQSRFSSIIPKDTCRKVDLCHGRETSQADFLLPYAWISQEGFHQHDGLKHVDKEIIHHDRLLNAFNAFKYIWLLWIY
jgi:hypothetical protein